MAVRLPTNRWARIAMLLIVAGLIVLLINWVPSLFNDNGDPAKQNAACVTEAAMATQAPADVESTPSADPMAPKLVSNTGTSFSDPLKWAPPKEKGFRKWDAKEKAAQKFITNVNEPLILANYVEMCLAQSVTAANVSRANQNAAHLQASPEARSAVAATFLYDLEYVSHGTINDGTYKSFGIERDKHGVGKLKKTEEPHSPGKVINLKFRSGFVMTIRDQCGGQPIEVIAPPSASPKTSKPSCENGSCNTSPPTCKSNGTCKPSPTPSPKCTDCNTKRGTDVPPPVRTHKPADQQVTSSNPPPATDDSCAEPDQTTGKCPGDN